MGTLTANYSLNLLSDDFWFGSPEFLEVSFNESQVTFYEPDLSTPYWHGIFDISSSGDLVGGTVESFELRDY